MLLNFVINIFLPNSTIHNMGWGMQKEGREDSLLIAKTKGMLWLCLGPTQKESIYVLQVTSWTSDTNSLVMLRLCVLTFKTKLANKTKLLYCSQIVTISQKPCCCLNQKSLLSLQCPFQYHVILSVFVNLHCQTFNSLCSHSQWYQTQVDR